MATSPKRSSRTSPLLAAPAFVVAAYFGMGFWTNAVLDQQVAALSGANGNGGRTTYKGVVFRDVDTLKAVIDRERSASLFPWTKLIPTGLSTVLASAVFGALGSMIRMFKRGIMNRQALPQTGLAVMQVAFGASVGVLLFGMCHLVPAMLVAGELNLRPTSVVILALFAGAFPDHVYQWLEGQFRSVLARMGQKGTTDA